MVTFPHAARRATRLAVLALATFLAACGGGGGEPTPPVVTPVAALRALSLPTVYVGGTVPLFVTVVDANDSPLAGRTVSYTSSNPAIATVANGAVTGVAPGATTIRASSEGKFVDIPVTVALVPVVTVSVTPSPTTVAIGGTVQLTAVARDSIGGILANRSVSWTTSDAAVATVSASGLVSGVANGIATVRATIEGKFADVSVSSGSVPTPIVTGIAPSPLTPGVTATISGSNFAPSAVDNTVTIDGVAATVTAASPTQLTVTVPALPCTPAHAATVQVIAKGLGGTTQHPVRAGTPVAIAGTAQQVLLAPATAACAELPSATGKYLVSVVNTTKAAGLDQSGTDLTFRIAGALPPGTAAAAIATPTVLRQSASLPARTAVSGTELVLGAAASLAGERLHESILESSRLSYERLRTGRAVTRASRSLVPSPRSSATLPALNETRKFRVGQFTTALNAVNGCSSFKEITARAVYVGTRSVVYEDVTAPLANTTDSYYQNIGKEFDDAMYKVDSTYFGDPLVTDQYTDNDHHLNMVFTPVIPTGVAGFVTSCDFFPRDSSGNPSTDDRQSNLGEYFYAVVPTAPGTGFSGNTADNWLRGMRHTIVHEVKHIASFGARLTNNATTFEESWLEEGTARHSEELWERQYVYNGAPWKGDNLYRATLYCDVRPTFGECTGKPFAMFSHFSTLYDVLSAPGSFSMFGRVADNDFNFYATTWSFVRYTMDRYATSEEAFLRGLTQSTTTSGLTSISAQAGGRPSADLLANWSLAMYLDDNTANPDLSFPTWHMHDIYAGMNADFGSGANPSFTRQYPLIPLLLGSPAFSIDNTGIKGGGFAQYLVPASAAGATTIRVGAYGSATGAASSALRIAIVRVP